VSVRQARSGVALRRGCSLGNAPLSNSSFCLASNSSRKARISSCSDDEVMVAASLLVSEAVSRASSREPRGLCLGQDDVQRIDPTASNPLFQANAAGFRMGVVRITGDEHDAASALGHEARAT
jgi:hypothetical protein